MSNDPAVSFISSVLAAFDQQRAALNANWNHQNPDVMSPTDLAAVRAAIGAIAQDTTKLAFVFGGSTART